VEIARGLSSWWQPFWMLRVPEEVRMTRLYKLSQGALLPVPSGRLSNEKMMQDWIERQPDLLGLDLLIIGREVATSHGGWIDLLGIDDDGDLAILDDRLAARSD
jgi:RecB family endonuclease NucS